MLTKKKMEKKNKGGVKEGGDLMDKVEQAKQERVAADIEKVLKDAGFGIQPFMEYNDFAIIPKIRLVKLPKKDEQIKTNETGETK